MIISLEELKIMYPAIDEKILEHKINAIECTIKGYTNNNFKNSYPYDVIDVALEMLKWKLEYSEKQTMGISSESISRYSVSYANMNDGNSTINGYPKSMMSRLKPYMKAKF